MVLLFILASSYRCASPVQRYYLLKFEFEVLLLYLHKYNYSYLRLS